MSRASLIHELNEVLRREYGIDRHVSDPITVRNLANIVMALKQGKVRGG
jgi:hypothetical protein